MGIIDHPMPLLSFSGVRRGALAALPFLVSNGLAGMIMGFAYRQAGFSSLASIGCSVVIYSATAQAVTLGMWSHPLPIAAMTGACLAINSRYLLMGAQLRPVFTRLNRRVMLLILYLLADASWLMTVSDSKRHGADAGYLFGCSLVMAVGWIGGTAAGYVLPRLSGGSMALGVSMLPLIFIATLMPAQWQDRGRALPWATSAICAILAARFIAAEWAMLVGGLAGTAIDYAKEARG